MLNETFLNHFRTLGYDEKTIKKVVFFINEGWIEDADEICDLRDFVRKKKNGGIIEYVWVLDPGEDKVSEEFKDFILCLKSKGFGSMGLDGYGYAQPGYTILKKSELQTEFNIFRKRHPDISIDTMCNLIVEAYRNFQNSDKPMIPQLHNYMKNSLELDLL